MSEQTLETPRSFEDVYSSLCKHFNVGTVAMELGTETAGTQKQPYDLRRHAVGQSSQMIVVFRPTVWAKIVDENNSFGDTWDAAMRLVAVAEGIPTFEEKQ